MKLIRCLLLILPFSAAAQKIISKGYDKSLRQQLVQTEPLAIVQQNKTILSVAFEQAGSSLYLETSGSNWGAATIDVNDPLILTLSNGASVKAKSTGLQSFTPNPQGSTYKHQYTVDPADVASLSQYNLVAIRKYLFSEFVDLQIPPSGAARLKDLSAVFLEALDKSAPPPFNKPVLAKKPTRIQVADIRDYVGQNVEFCGRVFITRFFESSEAQASILDFQQHQWSPAARAIIWREDKAKLGPGMPKAFYNNKDVCISGEVYLYQNTPYIRITGKNQIKVTSPVTTDEAPFFVNDTATLTGIVEAVSAAGANGSWTVQLRSPSSRQYVVLLVQGGQSRDAFNGMYANKPVQVRGLLTAQPSGLQMAVPDAAAVQLMLKAQ